MEEDIKNILTKNSSIKLQLVVQGLIVGIITGGVIVLNRVSITKLNEIFKRLYSWGNESITNIIIVIFIISLLGLLVGFMVKKEGMISGSGIPQVKGQVVNKIKINWLRVLIYKFLGGIIVLGTGLTVGREGPSVQIGAAIGEGVSEKICKKNTTRKEFLITAGASAGLSAAFNSPLAGIIFALEEIHRNFSPLVLLPAMAAAISADFISKNFLGMNHSLEFNELTALPLKYYWILIILGIVTGAMGVIFSKGIYLFQDFYNKFKNIKQEYKIIIPFILTSIVGLFFPVLLGGGHELIIDLSKNNSSIIFLIVLYVIKLLLLLICFGSGLPGGIFLPMLLLGAIIGKIIGIASVDILGINSNFVINFMALGMAGYFTAIVKAPITGIILIIEMTGSFNHLLSLSIVVIISYITSDLLKNEPIYEILLERLLKKIGSEDKEANSKKTLIEFAIEMGSLVEGKYIYEIDWPKDCLLVSIRRGDKEIIPRGKVKLEVGDYIIILVNMERRGDIIEEINKITLV